MGGKTLSLAVDCYVLMVMINNAGSDKTIHNARQLGVGLTTISAFCMCRSRASKYLAVSNVSMTCVTMCKSPDTLYFIFISFGVNSRYKGSQ